MYKVIVMAMMLAYGLVTKAEDGSRLWLRAEKVNKVRRCVKIVGKTTPTIKIAEDELLNYWRGPLVKLRVDSKSGLKEGAYHIQSSDKCIDITASTDCGLLYATYELLRLQETGKAVTSKTETPAMPIRILNHWDNLDLTIERGYAGKSIWLWDEIKEVNTATNRRHELAVRYTSVRHHSISISPTMREPTPPSASMVRCSIMSTPHPRCSPLYI